MALREWWEPAVLSPANSLPGARQQGPTLWPCVESQLQRQEVKYINPVNNLLYCESSKGQPEHLWDAKFIAYHFKGRYIL